VIDVIKNVWDGLMNHTGLAFVHDILPGAPM